MMDSYVVDASSLHGIIFLTKFARAGRPMGVSHFADTMFLNTSPLHGMIVLAKQVCTVFQN